MITEDYVSFETAKLLKEKGFDEACHTFYDSGHRHILKFVQNGLRNNAGVVANDGICVAPTLQMVMKWLRKKHNIHIYVENYGTLGWIFILHRLNVGNKIQSNEFYNMYEEACETAIKYCLENLI